MKIVHVTETLVGGVLAAVAALANRQSEAGHDVVVVYPRKPTVPAEAELSDRFRSEVDRRPLAYSSRLLAVPALQRAMGAVAKDAEVVHLHSTFAGAAGRLAPSRRRRVTVYSPHGWAFLRESSALSRRAALFVEGALLPRTDAVVLVSESEAQVARQHLGDGPWHVVRNGIDTAAMPTAAGSGGKQPVVAASGRLMSQKGPDLFAAVARRLDGRARFLWIGGGTDAEKERWLGDAPVEVTGWLAHEDVLDRLAGADVFLFPSRWEGMPIALMEAQAMGIPAVATDIVGNRDVIIDGVTGRLCVSADALGDALLELIESPQALAEMRAQSLGIQRVRLSDGSLGVDSVDLYRRIARTPRPGGRPPIRRQLRPATD